MQTKLRYQKQYQANQAEYDEKLAAYKATKKNKKRSTKKNNNEESNKENNDESKEYDDQS